MKNPIYKETQPFYVIVIISFVILVCVVLGTIFQWGNKPLSIIPAIIISIVLIIILLLFYKLDIVITKDFALASFGLGLVKRKVPISNLDLDTAQTIKTTWFWGIGYRITPHGTLLNTRTGNALHIKTKDKYSEFFVSTSYSSEIIAAIKEAQGFNNT